MEDQLSFSVIPDTDTGPPLPFSPFPLPPRPLIPTRGDIGGLETQEGEKSNKCGKHERDTTTHHATLSSPLSAENTIASLPAKSTLNDLGLTLIPSSLPLGRAVLGLASAELRSTIPSIRRRSIDATSFFVTSFIATRFPPINLKVRLRGC